jgi:predicted ATPase
MIALNKSIVSPILLRHTEEVKLLEGALRTVSQGQGQVVLMAGAPGIGKSWLVAETHRRAVAKGFTILIGSCFEGMISFPMRP